jgi:hypothetical protein
MAEYKGPLDYIDVAQRIVEFRAKYPQGSLQQVKLEFVNIGGKDFVVYTAAALRGPDDLHPGIGTAWEPIPGKTPFTRDSEVQNAETAAWGRAMVAALAVDTKQGIASAEEVRNRQAPADNPLRNAGDWEDKVNDLDTKVAARKLYNEAQKAGAGDLVLKKIEAKAKTLP